MKTKKLFRLLFTIGIVVLASYNCSSDSSQRKLLLKKWESVDKNGNKDVMEFKADSNCEEHTFENGKEMSIKIFHWALIDNGKKLVAGDPHMTDDWGHVQTDTIEVLELTADKFTVRYQDLFKSTITTTYYPSK